MLEAVGITSFEGRSASDEDDGERRSKESRRRNGPSMTVPLGPARCSTSALPPKRGSTAVRALREEDP